MLKIVEACGIRRPKQWIVTLQITCRADESLEAACWRWRPLPVGDTLAVQTTSDDGAVLRMYVHPWMADDAESAKREAVDRYRLSAADGDQVEVLEAIQAVEHDGSISL